MEFLSGRRGQREKKELSVFKIQEFCIKIELCRPPGWKYLATWDTPW
jgi:hypothetical protein